jgi:hypothetical protein
MFWAMIYVKTIGDHYWLDHFTWANKWQNIQFQAFQMSMISKNSSIEHIYGIATKKWTVYGRAGEASYAHHRILAGGPVDQVVKRYVVKLVGKTMP